MANPYDSSASADPFREQVYPPVAAAVPPAGIAAPTTFNGASDPLHGYGSVVYTEVTKSPVDTDTSKFPSQFFSGGGGPTPPPPPPPAAASAAVNFKPPGDSASAEAAAATASQPTEAKKMFTLPFFQQFFDINTRQLLLRLSNTIVPLNPPDFLMDRNWHFNESVGLDDAGGVTQETVLEEAGVVLSRKPDLYGPFWICTTLWMTLAVASNVMSKIAYTKTNTTAEPWKYNFYMASVAYVVIYLYCFLFSAIVYGIMQWKSLPATLTETLCLYGYSMFIVELVAILCMIPSRAAQWIFVLVGGAWSTMYLLINMWHMWKTTLVRNWFIGLVGFVTTFHMGLVVFLKIYFFNYKL